MKYEIRSIDKAAYEEWITNRGQWSLFQSYDWGQLLESQDIWVKRVGVYKDTQLVGTAQLHEVKAKRGKFLQVRQGPVVDPTLFGDEALWQVLTEFLKTEAKDRGALFIRINPMLEDSPQLKSIFIKYNLRPAPIHAMDAQICWVLDITKTEGELLTAMRKTTRYEIRRAEKMGVTVELSTNITQFMTLYRQTAQRQGFVTHQGVEEEFKLFHQEGRAELLLGFYERKLVAGAIIIYFGNQAIYHHGASVTSKVPASYAVQWEAIKRAQKRGANIYNFWGIAPPEAPNHPWKGLTLFKQGFGGELKRFIPSYDLPLSLGYAIPYTIEKLRKIKKGY